MASFLQVPCGHGDAVGDCPSGDRDCEPLDASGCLLGEGWDALLDGCGFCILVHCFGVHEVCSRRHVCRYTICM